MKNFFKKLNPMNAIERWIIKRLAKKVIKMLPYLQEKGKEVINDYSQKIEENAENLLEEIKITIVKFIEKYENKQK